MKKFPGFTLDPHNGRIYFDGGCDAAREVCEAMCCRRVFYVDITEEEAKSGLYEFDIICGINSENCSGPCHSCLNVRRILSKNPSGACVYLDQTNRCSIYEKRPFACREFYCTSGWVISDVLPTEKRNKVLSDALKEGLRKDMRFVRNECYKVRTIFYSAQQKEVAFVMEAPNRCKYTPMKYTFPWSGVTDEMLLYIYMSFDGVLTLGELQERAFQKFGPALTEDVFFEIVTMFLRTNVIVFRHASRVGGDICPNE